MPELPELELARRDLTRWTVGRTVLRAVVHDPTSVRHKLSTNPSDVLKDGAPLLESRLTGATATHVLRVGKRLAWQFDNGLSLLVHLGMSGKWAHRADDVVKHGKICLYIDGAEPLWFIDPRRFGCLTPVQEEAMDAVLRQGLGPDALDEAPSTAELKARMQTRANIKTALLDQKRLAGVGNIQAAEALWRAGVSPERRANDLTDSEWHALSEAIPTQLRWTIDVESDGEVVYLSEWGSQNPFAVYGREGEPCPKCGDHVVRAVHSGRSSFWCPSCQG